MIVRETKGMIAGMRPALADEAYVFCTTTDPELAAHCLPHALGLFREAEGLSFILTIEMARPLGFDCDTAMRRITLNVFSALDGVGLTAAVASALAQRGIACNMVAAFHHDHAFVPADRAIEALEALSALSADHQEGTDSA